MLKNIEKESTKASHKQRKPTVWKALSL